MEKIIFHKVNSKPAGKTGGNVWVSKEVNDQLETLESETGITKQRIADLLLRKALEVVEIL